MQSVRELERLHQLHLLIEKECTGTPAQLARRMQISKRSVHRLLEKLKDLDAVICFNRKRNTYYYFERFELEVSIKVKAISKNNTVKLYGGTFFDKKHFPASLWQ